jgi:outer membrane protein OmpA-like peptidoglycan-associated protein
MVTGYYLDTNSNENTFVEAATLPAAQVTPMSASSTLSVHFTLDSWTLTSADKTALRNYAAGLSAHGHGMALVVTGYVEPTPVNKDKVFLSTMRAKAVVKFLKSIGVTASFRTVAGGNGSAHNASSRKATISQA